MRHEKMEHQEALAILNFVEERLRRLDPEPKFFGKAKWHENMSRFEQTFLNALETGTHSFPGIIWSMFELNDRLFIGEYGMMELAEHCYKEDDVWIYEGLGEEKRIICKAG